MYIKIKNNVVTYPYTINNLKQDNPNVSFPSEITESVMAEFNIYEVRKTPKPNDYTKNISEDTPILIDGVYYQNWVQTDASNSEINLRIENKWSEIREIRNELLKDCDWTQLGDIQNVIKNNWQLYRQQLRDVTNQSNPFSIVWPVKP